MLNINFNDCDRNDETIIILMEVDVVDKLLSGKIVNLWLEI